jgi:hypothetical protein
MNKKSILPTQQINDIFYELLPILKYDNAKMVCNPTWLVVSPTRTDTRICTKASGSHDESLLPPSPHVSSEVDWVVGQPNAGSYDTKTTRYHHRETKEFAGQISSARQSTVRTYTGTACAKLIIILITLKQSGGENMNTSIKGNN